MKAVIFAATFLAAQLTASAAETAYSALRVVGRSQGPDSLNRVLELRARGGVPQPALWKITLDEPRARGGIREIEVQRGKIVSEKTPAGRGPGSPMNFNQLNLDSEGAFTVANQEAQKAGVPFDHVDYTLRGGTGGGAPVWELELFDGKNGRAGSIQIAADSGAVLRQQLDHGSRPLPQSRDDDHAYIEDRRGDDRRNPPPIVDSDGGYSRPGEPFRSVPDFFHRLKNRAERRTVQVENFFTGKGAREDRDRYDR